MSKTCAACRARKVRCDGVTPMCGPCAKARKPMECTYISGSLTSSGSKATLLQKGAACFACRRKKKRCDAKRPFCTTCKTAGKELDCQYEDTVHQSLTEALLAHTRELERRLALYESDSQSPSPQSSTQSLQTTPNSDSPPQSSDEQPVAEQLSEQNNRRSPSPLTDFLSTVSSLNIPSIATFPTESDSRPRNELTGCLPPELLHSILSSNSPFSIFPPTFPIPMQDLDDFRATFLAHHAQLGFYLRETKIKAIVIGDLSGVLVHPALVYIAQLMGGLLRQIQFQQEVDVTLEMFQLHSVLQSILEPPDPVTRLQVHDMLALYFLFRRQLPEGRKQLEQAMNVVAELESYFPLSSSESVVISSEVDEDIQERIAALSELLYLDKAAVIVNLSSSVVHDRYDTLFKAVPKSHPWIPNNNLVFLRAKSAYLLEQTRRLINQWPDILLNSIVSPSGSEEQTKWYEGYWDLIQDATQHIASLNILMLKSTLSLNREHGLSLKMCMMISMTALAELHRLLASCHLESRQMCLDVIFEMIGITKGFKDEDYMLLDPILGISWTLIATVLSQERNTTVDEISGHNPNAQWNQVLVGLVCSSTKLGVLPYMEQTVQTICEIATTGQSLDDTVRPVSDPSLNDLFS